MFVRKLFLLFCFISLSSCANYGFNINSITSVGFNPESTKGSKYIIKSAMKDTSEGDLYFQEYSRYIENGLGLKGYTKVSNVNNADIIIFVSYGTSKPDKNFYAYSSPFGISSNAFFDSNFGFGVGFNTVNIDTYSTYTKFLTLTAADRKSYGVNKNTSGLWSVTVTNDNEIENIRVIMPYLVLESVNYIGTSVTKSVNVKIDDPEVKVITAFN